MDVVLLVCSETVSFDWVVNLMGDYLVISISGWMCHSESSKSLRNLLRFRALHLVNVVPICLSTPGSVHEKYQLIMSPHAYDSRVTSQDPTEYDTEPII
jgi:hypothetical protein